MSIVTEETAKRIADSLDELKAILRGLQNAQPGPYRVSYWPPLNPTQCGYCRGYHGTGLPCPMLTPMSGDI